MRAWSWINRDNEKTKRAGNFAPFFEFLCSLCWPRLSLLRWRVRLTSTTRHGHQDAFLHLWRTRQFQCPSTKELQSWRSDVWPRASSSELVRLPQIFQIAGGSKRWPRYEDGCWQLRSQWAFACQGIPEQQHVANNPSHKTRWDAVLSNSGDTGCAGKQPPSTIASIDTCGRPMCLATHESKNHESGPRDEHGHNRSIESQSYGWLKYLASYNSNLKIEIRRHDNNSPTVSK